MTPVSEPDPGTLAEFLAADEIIPLPTLSAAAWDRVRRQAMRRLVWQFCTFRNIRVHRGRPLRDAIGFSWGGIYRSLQVGSIVTTSYRNEGHSRAGERIFGTGDFFGGAFRLPESSGNDSRPPTRPRPIGSWPSGRPAESPGCSTWATSPTATRPSSGRTPRRR